jgi:CBS domain-containing protein/anti-sigma regulatory factor (Ser/Thr protein kinase)
MKKSFPQEGSSISDQVINRITRVEELAYELKIEEVMTHDTRTFTPDTSMQEVMDTFRDARISGAPVLENNRLVGVFSMEDLIQALRVGDIHGKIRSYITWNVVTVRAKDPAIEALKIFVTAKYGRLPVLDNDGNLVGIITKGDITNGLLQALQHDYEEEELIRYRASHLFEDILSDRTSLILRYKIRPRDFNHGGTASSNIKRALLRLGANPIIARRCGIAIYEAEMNLVIHSTNGGSIRVEIEPHQISMEAYDDGPGITNISLAMQPGYSTASEEVREKGFGAGMGLANIQRCVDEMKIESSTIRGTNLRMKIFLEKKDPETRDSSPS